jgi:hypothetical protein
MKLRNIFFGLFILVIALTGCDEVAQPLVQKQVNSILPTTTPSFTDSSAISGPYAYTQYKLLLEDCMGNQCPNCPTACAIGDSLISPTGGYHYGQIVMMEENMGPLSLPGTRSGFPSYAFTTSLQSIVGNAWCTLFNLAGDGFPIGLINRYGWTPTNPNMDVQYGGTGGTIWQDSIAGILQNNTSAAVTIKIHDSCWTSPRIIGATFLVTFKNALPSTNAYSLETLIVEDHVISWQMDDDIALGYDSTYDHRNVLRGAFGNNSGGLSSGVVIPVSVSSVAGGTWSSFQTYDFTKGENGNAAGWNMANCYIVAFVFSQSTQAVVQAEMIKVE